MYVYQPSPTSIGSVRQALCICFGLRDIILFLFFSTFLFPLLFFFVFVDFFRRYLSSELARSSLLPHCYAVCFFYYLFSGLSLFLLPPPPTLFFCQFVFAVTAFLIAFCCLLELFFFLILPASHGHLLPQFQHYYLFSRRLIGTSLKQK